MSSKYDKVEQLYRQLIPRLSRPECWDKMLRQIAPFWKLANFTEGMLLTEQLPNATAVASFEQWKKMGRYVKFREKSVIIFASEFDTSAKYLFDISQTYGNAITPKWEMNARLADGIIAKSEEYFGVNVTNLHHLITKSLDNKLVSYYNYICKSIPAVSTDSRVRQLIYDSAKVICMTRCGIAPAEIQADFSNIGLLKKEISRIEIGNAGFELAKQVLREIDKAVRSEINERNHDESNVRGRDLRDSLRGEERDLLSEGRQLRQEGHEHTRPESPRSDGGAGQNSASVHKHERTVPHDMGGDSPESGAQPQRNPGGAETENAVQPEHRNEGAAADGDIHSGAGLGMGYDQELRELADSGSSVEEHDSGTEHDNPFDDDGSLTETAEYDNEVDFSDGGSTSFLSGDQYSLFDTAPPAAEASKDQNNTALTELLMTGTGFEDGKWRVYTYYNSEHPSTEEFANFLKKEYGIGGSSSVSDTFKFSWYDAKGIKITMNSGEDVLFRWNVAAKTAAGLLDSGEYFSQKDNDNHLRNCVRHARESIQYENPYSTQTGIDAIAYLDSIGYDFSVGQENGTGYYLFPDSVCVSTLLRTKPADRYVICAPKCTLSDEYLSEHNITFLKTDEDIRFSDVGFDSDEKLLEQIKAALHQTMGHDVSVLEESKSDPKRRLYFSELYEAVRNGDEIPLIDSQKHRTDDVSVQNASAIHFENWRLVPDGMSLILTADRIAFGGEKIPDCCIQSFSEIDNAIDYLFERGLEIEIAEKENDSETMGHDVSLLEENPPIEKKPEPADFVIPADFEYSHGKKAKFQDNITAIKLLNQLETEKRYATPEEQTTLARYSGWGGIPEAFDKDNDSWNSEYTELKNLLSEMEYRNARSSTNTAFYTDPVIIRSIYKGLEQFGFKSGRILDPSTGTGNFYGNMPEEMRNNSTLDGVEIDTLTARIAHYLYPRANIQNKGFERAKLEKPYDIVVGNVPFGDFKPYDPKYDSEYLIHDYFFIKSLDLLKAGGIAALITSKGTLDKYLTQPRLEMLKRAELIGAVRLPNNAFESAGTETVTDILFFQKRENVLTDEEIDSMDLNKTAPWISIGGSLRVGDVWYQGNQYYAQHVENILGELKEITGRFGREITVVPNGNLQEQLDAAISRLSATFSAEPTIEEIDEDETEVFSIPDGVKPFTYYIEDNRLYYADNHTAKPFSGDSNSTRAIRMMVDIVQKYDHIIMSQRRGCSDEVFEAERLVLNSAYDDFVKRYGPLSSAANQRRFADDVRSPKLFSLEIESRGADNKPVIKKADVFRERTVNQYRNPTHADSAVEAMHLSLNLKQKIDLAYMAGLCGKTEDEIIEELGDQIYCDPARNGGDKYSGWVTAEEYLSGRTRDKLGLAIVKAEENPERFSRNVEALKEHQPPQLSIADISFRLGSFFIPSEMFTQFMYDTFETSMWARNSALPRAVISCEYIPATNEWRIPNKTSERSVKVNEEFGTKRLNAYELTELVLNQRKAEVKDKVTYRDSDGVEREKYVLNRKETILARDKQAKIEQAFHEWILADPTRIKTIEEIYNNRFNAITPRKYDGSYIEIPGMAKSLSLRPHQKDVIARFAATGGGLMAHEVGAGKTAASAALGMYLKSIGAINKPLYVVPNAVIGQFGEEFQRFFPQANILVATEKDFQTSNRRRFLAKISSCNFDAVIISQSQFEKIPVSLERQEEYYGRKIDALTVSIEQMRQDQGQRLSVKKLESMRKSITTKVEKLRAAFKKDNLICFEDLGCDYLVVDEAHAYKNLAIFSKMNNVAGVNVSSNSQRAFDLEIKIRYIQELNNGGGVCLMTGTPISNAISEMFVWQYLLQFPTLRDLGIEYFDNWASVYGEITQAMEVKPSGSGFRMRTRFANFVNLPELCNLFGEVTDLVKTGDLDYLKLPQISGGKPEMIICEPSPSQEEQRDEGMERAKKIESGAVKPEEDNMLAICTFMTKVALDGRILDPEAEDYEGSKINQCVKRILEIDRENPKTTQVVFCDTNTPKYDGKFTVYEDIKQKLIESGQYKPEEIAFVHDAKNDKQRIEIFEKVNEAKIRLIIGSTGKLGTGVNIQRSLIAMHHLDAPYRPSDIEQRNGRGIRQGNNNPEVTVIYYATKGTFDTYRWQLLEKKQETASKVLSGKPVSRSCKDIDEVALTFSEMKAATTDNPLIAEKLTVDNEVARLSLLETEYLSHHRQLAHDIQEVYPKNIQSFTRQRENALIDIQTLNSNPYIDECFRIEFDGRMITEKEKAAAEFESKARAYMIGEAFRGGEPVFFAKYHGFEIGLRRSDQYSCSILVKGANLYKSDYNNSGTGAITRIDNMLERLAKQPEEFSAAIEKAEKQLANARSLYDRPFEYAAELKELIEKQAYLNAQLEFGSDSNDDQIVDDNNDDEGESEEMEM